MPTKLFMLLLSVVLLGSSTFANTHSHWNPSGHSRSHSTRTRETHRSSPPARSELHTEDFASLMTDKSRHDLVQVPVQSRSRTGTAF